MKAGRDRRARARSRSRREGERAATRRAGHPGSSAARSRRRAEGRSRFHSAARRGRARLPPQPGPSSRDLRGARGASRRGPRRSRSSPRPHAVELAGNTKRAAGSRPSSRRPGSRPESPPASGRGATLRPRPRGPVQGSTRARAARAQRSVRDALPGCAAEHRPGDRPARTRGWRATEGARGTSSSRGWWRAPPRRMRARASGARAARPARRDAASRDRVPTAAARGPRGWRPRRARAPTRESGRRTARRRSWPREHLEPRQARVRGSSSSFDPCYYSDWMYSRIASMSAWAWARLPL